MAEATIMAKDSRELLVEQDDIIDMIKNVIINYEMLPKASVTLAKTRACLSDLKTLWQKARDLHNRITLATTAEEKETLSYFLQDEYSAAGDAYYEAVDYLAEAISNLEAKSSACDSTFRDETELSSVRLPRIRLPTFSGKFSEWLNFRGIFEGLIHSNKAIPNILKLLYLGSSLTGDAAMLMNGFVNYTTAWELLVSEYDHKRMLIYTHIHSFASLPKSKFESVTELRELRDTVRVALAKLSRLGCPVSQWDHLLVYIITEKFSSETREKWHDELSNTSEYPSYKELDAFLSNRIYLFSNFQHVALVTNNSQNKSRSSVNSLSVSKCINCTGSHSLAKCEKFLLLSVEQRYTLARKKRVCFNCLRSGHFTPKCPSKSRCKHCRCKHHSLLHFAVDEKANVTNDLAPVTDDDKRALIHRNINSFASLPKRKSESAIEFRLLRNTVRVALIHLSGLGCPVSQWDHLLVYIITEKFDSETREEWYYKLRNTREYPSYEELNAFLSCRIGTPHILENRPLVTDNSRNKSRSSVNSISVSKCINCTGSHSLAKCEKFLLLSVEQRDTLAREKRVCFNCLRSDHFTPKCPSKSRCKHCRRKHHSLLHLAVG